MSKTNFTKVEEALIKGMDQQAVQSLLEATGKTAAGTLSKQTRLALRHLQHDLRWLLKLNKEIAPTLHLSQAELLRLIQAKPQELTPEDWQRIQELQCLCTEQKQEVEKKLAMPSNEAIVRKERRKHINKRFNVSDKWLPLK